VQAEGACLHCNVHGEIMTPGSLSPSLPPSLAFPLFLSLLPATSFFSPVSFSISPSPSLSPLQWQNHLSQKPVVEAAALHRRN
jgi:hypothetical protein